MQFPKRHTRITYEGISFLSILAFIVIGSILRQINLLVLLSGLMIAPFFFNWRISRKMLRRVRFRRQAPEWINAGKTFSLSWEIENLRQSMPAWGIRINDCLRYEQASRKESERVTLIAKPIEPGNSIRVSCRCLLPQRGICELGPAEASSAFPVGLIRTKVKIRDRQLLFVAPRLGSLTDQWERFTRSNHEGGQHSQKKSSNQQEQFFAIRPWQFGDNRSLIHWRSTAKQGELMVRQFDQRVDRSLVVALDLQAGQASLQEIETAISFFATIVQRVTQGRKKATFGVFGDDFFISNSSARGDQAALLMQHLAVVQAGEQTEVRSGIEQMLASNRGRNLPVVISTRSRLQAEASEGQVHDSVKWIDVSAGDADSFFRLPEDPTGTFVVQEFAGKKEATR